MWRIFLPGEFESLLSAKAPTEVSDYLVILSPKDGRARRHAFAKALTFVESATEASSVDAQVSKAFLMVGTHHAFFVLEEAGI